VLARVVLLAVLALTLASGCGGDDDDSGDSPATTDTTPAATPTTEQDAPAGAPDEAELKACLSKAKLELKPGSEPVTDEEGQPRTRKPLSGAEAEYAGYVQWPSKGLADIYLAKDDARAGEIETEAREFVQAFGLEPDDYVRRAGGIVMTFGTPPPSDAEAKAVEDCAGG
jgi:hypothetical protein